jgi:hypothetical protein
MTGRYELTTRNTVVTRRFSQTMASLAALAVVAVVTACSHPSTGLPSGPANLGSVAASGESSAATTVAGPSTSPTSSTTTASPYAAFCSILDENKQDLLTFAGTPAEAQGVLPAWQAATAAAPSVLAPKFQEVTETIQRAAEGNYSDIDKTKITSDLSAITSWAGTNCD